MKKYWVYIHTCPNGKKYVGITTQARPELRWKEGKGYWYNKHFYSAILKHGWNNFQHEVFEVDSAEEMYRKEIELISFYHSNDPKFGYNNSSGGEHSGLDCRCSEESRKRMSEVQKKVHADPEYRKRISESLKGRSFSKETRERIAEANRRKAEDPEIRKRISESLKGRSFSEDHKRHIAEAAKKKWSDPEVRKHMSEARKGKPKPRVKIKLPDGTILEMSKQNLARNYVNKGKEFEYVS